MAKFLQNEMILTKTIQNNGTEYYFLNVKNILYQQLHIHNHSRNSAQNKYFAQLYYKTECSNRLLLNDFNITFNVHAFTVARFTMDEISTQGILLLAAEGNAVYFLLNFWLKTNNVLRQFIGPFRNPVMQRSKRT